MAREAALKICEANIELMTEREHLDMIERSSNQQCEQGVTSVYEERPFRPNNN